MLFSNPTIAQFINEHFEAAWESVRPVPMVHIDFGSGKTITRTLHGNIATYLCLADGRVLDIVPGVYTPEAYLPRLKEFVLIHTLATWPLGGTLEEKIARYHAGQARAMTERGVPDVLVRMDRGKAVVELPVKLMAAGALHEEDDGGRRAAIRPSAFAEGTAVGKALREDARLNEGQRRLKIHEKLASTGPLPPEQLVKWLYKEVLNADLDDPYLGLGEMLFGDYPFAESERAAAP